MKAACPICRRELPTGENPFRPFCSERCRMIDLDNWLTGRYRVSSPATVEPEDSGGAESETASETGFE